MSTTDVVIPFCWRESLASNWFSESARNPSPIELCLPFIPQLLITMYNIESNSLKVTISSKGAELKSIWHKQHQLEYMWDADPSYWAKTSPVLFPIVGTLKNNTYSYDGSDYQLSRHGFARDKEFVVTAQHPSTIRFTLESDEITLAVFPFPFSFSIVYSVIDDALAVSYEVQNKGKETMPFSVGGHPAFKLPLTNDTAYDDYELKFEKEETAGRWPITADGLIDKTPQEFLQQESVLPLTKDLFKKDAIVLKQLQSDWVQLQSAKTSHGLRFNFKDFPYLGLWAAPGANFLCIEPWCGIADSISTDQNIFHKEGINQLAPETLFKATWNVNFF